MTNEEIKEYELLKKKNDLENYAFEFWQKLSDNIFKPNLPTDLLPLTIKITQPNDPINIYTGTTTSRLLPSGASIYFVTVLFRPCDSVNIVQRRIRHELLHLALKLSKLKSSDFDAVFKILCDYYDANFYKKLTGLEKELYDRTIDLMNQGLRLLKGNTFEYANIQMKHMIEVLGNTEITEESQIDSVVEKLDKIMKESYAIINGR